MSGRVLVGGPLLILAVGLAVWWLQPAGAPQRETAPPMAGPVVPVPSGAPVPVPSVAEVPAEDALPRALRGLRPSGGLRVDSQGHFVPDHDALLFFEYFLSASNEASLDALRGHMRRAIAERLRPPADAEAEAFLEQYLAYRDSGAEELADPRLAASADLERRMQWIRELRREAFGADLAARLFGEEEDAVRAQLEARRVREDAALGPDERRTQLAAIEQRYPDAMRAARARAVAPVQLMQEEAWLREAGAGEAEIHALRVERFGPEAAERLRAADERRTQWQARLDAYRVERDTLVAGITDAEARERMIDILRREHFSEAELRRVAILDRVAEAEASP